MTDLFNVLDEPVQETPQPADTDLIVAFEEHRAWLMAPPDGMTADDIAEVEKNFTAMQTELVARGLIDPEPTNGEGHNGAEDTVRDCTIADYDRLVDTLVENGVHPNKVAANLFLAKELERHGSEPYRMTWHTYNDLNRIVAGLCEGAASMPEKKPQTTRKKRGSGKASSGTVQNAAIDGAQATSQSDATASDQDQSLPASDSQSAEDHNRFAFLDQIDEWIAYEDAQAQTLPDEERPNSVHYISTCEHFAQRGLTKVICDHLNPRYKEAKCPQTWKELGAFIAACEDYARKSQAIVDTAPKTASGYNVNNEGEVTDLPAALRILGFTEQPDPGTPEATQFVDRVLEVMDSWQHKIDTLNAQKERQIKPVQSKIEWFLQTFGPYIDKNTKDLIRLHNTVKSGKTKGEIKPKYWDYDHGRISYSKSGGVEIFSDGVYHQFMDKFLKDYVRYEAGEMTPEEQEGFAGVIESYQAIADAITIETVAKIDKKVVLAAAEAGLAVPGVKIAPEEPLATRKIEGIK